MQTHHCSLNTASQRVICGDDDEQQQVGEGPEGVVHGLPCEQMKAVLFLQCIWMLAQCLRQSNSWPETSATLQQENTATSLS